MGIWERKEKDSVSEYNVTIFDSQVLWVVVDIRCNMPYSIGVNNDQAALRAKASYVVRSSDLLVELGLETLHYREKNL